MKLHQTTLIELDERERATLIAAGDTWARRNTLCRYRTGRIKRVAKALDVGPETLRCWERGSRRPSWAKFEQWCVLLGVSELDLAWQSPIVMITPASSSIYVTDRNRTKWEELRPLSNEKCS